MRWGDYMKLTAVRRVVWIVVGLAVYALLSAFGVAQAAVCGVPTLAEAAASAGSSDTYEYEGQARAACNSIAQEVVDNVRGMNAVYEFSHCEATGLGGIRFIARYTSKNERLTNVCGRQEFSHSDSSVSGWLWSTPGCPGGGEWREDLKRCFDPSECMARNQQEGFGVPTTRPWRDHCIAGCKLAFDGNQGVVCSTLPNGSVSCGGSLQWTGDQCDLPPGAEPEEDVPPTRPDKATCTAAGDGQSFCIKPDGQQCYTASSGREVCWRPTETGEKSDRDVMQKRNPGPTEIPPSNLTLPTGDTLEKSGDSITTETTRTQGNTSSTTTTTTTNYQTQFGTNPGTGDEGAPADGSGGAEGGEGDSDEGSAEGGGDCDTPPIVRGDAILGMVADQTWATRCAVEAGNAAKVTGDVGDCSQPFTVEGDNANAHKLRAMREQICMEGARGEREGISSGLDSEIAAMEGEHESIWGEPSDPGSIVTTRYGGGGSCPQISVELPGVGVWEPPASFCSLLAALRLLFITVATVWALRIIGS